MKNNNIIATYTLKATGKGKEAAGNKLHVVDCVRLYLLRHIPYSSETSSYSIAPLKSVQEYDSVNGLPTLKQQRYSYIRNPLREGYVYVYIEKKNGQGIYQEYEVSQEGNLNNLVWSDADDSSISWHNPKREQARTYIPLKKEVDKKIWIAFSYIRWNREYAQNVLIDEGKRNKRMQVINCEECFNGNYTEEESFSIDDAAKSWQHSLYLNYMENNYDSRQKAFTARQNEKLRQAQVHIEENKTSGDFYVSVTDPLGVADILCTDIIFKFKELQTLLEKMRTGNFEDPYDKSELAALIDLGTIVYRMWDTKTSIFYKYSSHLNGELLKNVLQVEQRKAIREKINKIRCALYKVVCDNAYQQVIEDFLVEDTGIQLYGKSYLCSHINGVLSSPKSIDGFIDNSLDKMYTHSPEEPDIKGFVEKIIMGNENTGQLLGKEWNLDDIAKVSSLAISAGQTFDDIVSNLGKLTNAVEAKSLADIVIKLFRFTTKKGKHLVKFPECEIPDNMKRKVDYSRLSASTMKGYGKAYTIDFSKVTDSNRQPLSISSFFKNVPEELSINVDTALSRWEKTILNYGDDKWKKGIEKFVKSPWFIRGMAGLNIISLTIAIQKEKKNGKDYVDIVAYSLATAFFSMKYIEQTKILENIILKKVFTGVDFFTGISFAIASITDSVLLFKQGQNIPATLFFISGLSGGGSTLLSFKWFRFVSYKAILALITISFISALLAEWLKPDDLQLLLENCAFGKEPKIKANSGLELLLESRKKSLKVKPIWQKYLHSQQWVLNQLTTLYQGIISANLRFYFEYKYHPVGGNQAVFKSTLLDYITVSLHLLNMPLVQGKADFNIIHFNKEGNSRNLSDYLDAFEDNIAVDAEKGLVVAKFNIKKEYKTNYRKYFTNNGQIKIMVRTIHTMMDGKSVNTPASINGDEQCASFYFSCNNTCDFTQVRSGGLTTEFADSKPPLENSRLFYEQKLIKSELGKWVK